MELILLERVEKLGKMGDRVNVKPGFARNFLLPKGKALRATASNVAFFEQQKAALEAANTKGRETAEKLAKKLDGLHVSLIRQASESGHLYGSVTSRDIAEALTSKSGEDVKRQQVKLNHSFKTIGLFEMPITLHPEVIVNVIVNIARSVEEALIQEETGQALIAGNEDEEDVMEEEVAEEQTEESSDEEKTEEEAA